MAAAARPTEEELEALARLWNESQILRHLGLRIRFEAHRVLVDLPEVRAEHRGGLGTSAVNGLVLAGMFDLALGSTVVLVHPHRRSATVQLSMSFERPVFGTSARCEAVIDRRGQRTLFASGRILDERGEVCARCQAVVAVSRQPADGPADGPSG
jgi:acyl-coenzyme A thioesterase PaaI-like protein